MRYVIVPSPVAPVMDDGKPAYEIFIDENQKAERRLIGTLSLYDYLRRHVFNERGPDKGDSKRAPRQEGREAPAVNKLGQGYELVRRCIRLEDLFQHAKPGDVAEVQDKDWELVADIIREHDWANARYAMQMAPFEDAWMRATEERPKVPAVDASKTPLPAAEASA